MAPMSIHQCHVGSVRLVKKPMLWSHDLDAAYRQFGVRNQSYSFTFFFTDRGASLWRHGALAFGATSSVWSFNRAADCPQFVTRKLLLVGLFHYLDDFAAIDQATWA